MRKDTCGVLPPWFRRFGTREPGTPPAKRTRSHLRGSVQSVRSTFPTCANGAGRMQPSTPLHPIRTSTYSAYNWSIQGRMRDLEGQRQRDLAGSLVRANEVASPNHALSSSSVPSQTNVHPSQRNVHPVKRSGPLLWHGERSGYGHGFGPDAWRGHDGAWRPDWHKDGPTVGGHGDIETLHL